jgi:type II secretory pathway pseudopilin PulG
VFLAPARLAPAVLALAILALLLALALAMAVPAGASARARSAGSACAVTARHASRHERRAASHCSRRSSHRGPSAHQRPTRSPSHSRTGAAGKGMHRAAAAKKRTPALCEDGSVPVRGPEGFSCDDGSEPSCADGSEPLTAPDGQPLCEAPGESGGEDAAGECLAETGECEAGQGNCEASSEGGEAASGCEGASEGEGSAGQEAERAQPVAASRLTLPWAS